MMTTKKKLTPSELREFYESEDRVLAALIDAGLTREEAFNLKWEDIDFENGVIQVREK